MRRLLPAIVVLVAAACSGGTTTAPPPPPAATNEASEEATTAEPTEDERTAAPTEEPATEAPTDDETTPAPTAVAGDFCTALQELVTQGAAFSAALSGLDQEGVDAYRASFPALAAASLAAAPPEVAADLALTLGYQEQVVARLEGVDIRDRSLEYDTIFAGADDPALQAAGARVNAYAQDVCGIRPAVVEGVGEGGGGSG